MFGFVFFSANKKLCGKTVKELRKNEKRFFERKKYVIIKKNSVIYKKSYYRVWNFKIFVI